MNTSQQHKKTRGYKLSPDDYRRILSTIKLRSLELESCRMNRPSHYPHGELIKAVYGEEATLLNPSDNSFNALHSYKLTGLLDGDKVIFELEASYLLSFSSKELVGNEFFDIFKDMNLAVHTWPFFREFVSSMTARTNLPVLTLPLRITGQ